MEEILMYKKSKYNKEVQQSKTKEMYEKIVTNLKTIVENGEYEDFLKFRKNFRSYSFINIILIYSQFKDATRVARKS